MDTILGGGGVVAWLDNIYIHENIVLFRSYTPPAPPSGNYGTALPEKTM